MPSVTASRCNLDVHALYERLLRAGKTKMSALGAAMQKMAHLVFGVLKSRKTHTVADSMFSKNKKRPNFGIPP
jgi:hypothetical protein